MPRSTFSLAAAVALAITFALACAGPGAPTGATCPTNSTLTYANFGQAFVKQYCLECHAGKDQPRLDTQIAVKGEIDRIDRSTASGPNGTNTYMPEDRDIPVAERTKLGEWLACGAK